MEKTIQINVPEGYEIDKEKSTFENIVFKPIKKGLPKSWEELEDVSGHFVSSQSDVQYSSGAIRGSAMNNFTTKEQAEAVLALAQLSQLREVYRAGWEPNWADGNSKFVITRYDDNIGIDSYVKTSYFLSFQSKEVRDMFLENFRDLIEQAKPLMS